MDADFATAGAQAALGCLDGSSLELSDVDVIVAAPARRRYRAALANRLGVPVDRIVVADDERMHTASLAAALDQRLCSASRRLTDSSRRRQRGNHRGCRAIPSASPPTSRG